jgi:hypothetical protein
MPDENEKPRGVRRVGAKDRKPKLDGGRLVFPPSAPPPEGEPPTPSEEGDAQFARPANADERFAPPRPVGDASVGAQQAAPPRQPDSPTAEPSPALPPDLLDDFAPPDERFAPPGEADERFAPPRPASPLQNVVSGEDERFPPVRPTPRTPVGTERPASVPRGGTGKPPARRGCAWQNGVALLFVLASIGMVYWGVTLWQNPFHPLNPLPPFTPVPIVVTATPPPTLPPSPTPLPPTATFTPIPLDAFAVATEEATDTATAEVTLDATDLLTVEATAAP